MASSTSTHCSASGNHLRIRFTISEARLIATVDTGKGVTRYSVAGAKKGEHVTVYYTEDAGKKIAQVFKHFYGASMGASFLRPGRRYGPGSSSRLRKAGSLIRRPGIANLPIGGCGFRGTSSP